MIPIKCSGPTLKSNRSLGEIPLARLWHGTYSVEQTLVGISYQMDAFQQLCRMKGLEKSTICLVPEVWDWSLSV